MIIHQPVRVFKTLVKTCFLFVIIDLIFSILNVSQLHQESKKCNQDLTLFSSKLYDTNNRYDFSENLNEIQLIHRLGKRVTLRFFDNNSGRLHKSGKFIIFDTKPNVYS